MQHLKAEMFRPIYREITIPYKTLHVGSRRCILILMEIRVFSVGCQLKAVINSGVLDKRRCVALP